MGENSVKPLYKPFGWEHWPDFPWMSYQFRRALGETQEGGGAVSECFQAASKMVPGDKESWYQEWKRIAERNERKGDEAEKAGHGVTARHAWLRASDYYRSAEFWLPSEDPRRLELFTRCEESFGKAMKHMKEPAEAVKIPYEGDSVLYGYFIKPSSEKKKWPVLISFGGLDSFKEELYFMIARGALARGIACLLVDGPGQGGTLRREKIHTRYDYEVPVGRCIDYLEERDDVDTGKLGVSGTSLGGYYAARAGSMEKRISATISHGAIWSVLSLWKDIGEDYGLAEHIKWVFGYNSIEETKKNAADFTLEGVLENMRGKYFVIQGGHDFITRDQAQKVYDYAKSRGVDVTLKIVEEEETGSEHCQHDNPTLGEDFMMDWLAEALDVQ